MRTFLPKEKEQSQLQERRHPDRESALGGCSHTGGWQVFTGEAMPIRLVLLHLYNHQFSSVQLLSWVQLFAIPWTTARQASLSITNSQSLLKLMSIESVMPSNHLIQPSHFIAILVVKNNMIINGLGDFLLAFRFLNLVWFWQENCLIRARKPGGAVSAITFS